jgi:hypothetical protein
VPKTKKDAAAIPNAKSGQIIFVGDLEPVERQIRIFEMH